MIARSLAELLIGTLATSRILMTALPVAVALGVLLAAAAFAFVLDTVKAAIFSRLRMV